MGNSLAPYKIHWTSCCCVAVLTFLSSLWSIHATPRRRQCSRNRSRSIRPTPRRCGGTCRSRPPATTGWTPMLLFVPTPILLRRLNRSLSLPLATWMRNQQWFHPTACRSFWDAVDSTNDVSTRCFSPPSTAVVLLLHSSIPSTSSSYCHLAIGLRSSLRVTVTHGPDPG